MTRLLVDVKLKELVPVEEASPSLVDEQVVLVLLGDHVRVVAVTQRRPDLNSLPGNLEQRVDGVDQSVLLEPAS